MKILVATDGSPSSLDAVSYAAKLVGMLQPGDHRISLINVHDDAGLRHAKSRVGGTAVDDYLRELVEEDVAPSRQLLASANVPHDVIMRNGPTAQEIVACAGEGGFDLIVMGSKGRGAVADLLIGSVASRVLAASKSPVLLVK